MSGLRRLVARVGRFFGLEGSALFRDLPPAYGDTVPPDLRAFASESKEHLRQPDAEPWDVPRPQSDAGVQDRRRPDERVQTRDEPQS